jgi:hypothetical protein
MPFQMGNCPRQTDGVLIKKEGPGVFVRDPIIFTKGPLFLAIQAAKSADKT